MKTEQARPRVRSGVPTGGQFATTQRGETDLELDPSAPLASSDGLDGDEMLKKARGWAAVHGRHPGIERDDLAQDAVVAFLIAKRNAAENETHLEAQGNGSNFPKSKGGQTGYLGTVTQNFAKRAHGGKYMRSRDIYAMRELSRRIDEIENERGTSVSDKERDEIASQVREALTGDSRPSVGFHRNNAEIVADWDFDAVPTDRKYEPEYEAPNPMVTAETDQLDDLITEGGRTNRAQARRLAWDAIATATDAPRAVPDSFRPADGTKIRAAAKEMGGARKLAETWESGEDTAETERVLFAPFGNPGSMSTDSKQAVVDTLLRNRDYSDNLWESAMTAATIFRTR